MNIDYIRRNREPAQVPCIHHPYRESEHYIIKEGRGFELCGPCYQRTVLHKTDPIQTLAILVVLVCFSVGAYTILYQVAKILWGWFS